MPVYQAPPATEFTKPRNLINTIASVCACFEIVCALQNADH